MMCLCAVDTCGLVVVVGRAHTYSGLEQLALDCIDVPERRPVTRGSCRALRGGTCALRDLSPRPMLARACMQDAAAAASRADSEDEEELLRALQGLRVTLGEVEAELDSLEAQRDHSSRR